MSDADFSTSLPFRLPCCGFWWCRAQVLRSRLDPGGFVFLYAEASSVTLQTIEEVDIRRGMIELGYRAQSA